MGDHVITVADRNDVSHQFLVVPVTVTVKGSDGGLGGVVQAPVLVKLDEWNGNEPISNVYNNQLPEVYKQIRALRLMVNKGLTYQEAEDLA